MISPEMRRVFASSKLRVHPDDYVIASLDPAQRAEALVFCVLKPFTSVTWCGDEVSVVARWSDWEKKGVGFSEAKVEGPYTLITFDIVLDLDLVGYLSVVSAALAEAGVSIYALSSYLRDHILVRKEDADQAVAVVEALFESCRDALPVSE